MNPVDFSRSTYAQIEQALGALRVHVWNGLKQHGPCTTAELATRMEMSVLTVRPRVTELVQLGLARLVPTQHRGHEGVYEACTVENAIALQQDIHAHEHQGELRIQA